MVGAPAPVHLVVSAEARIETPARGVAGKVEQCPGGDDPAVGLDPEGNGDITCQYLAAGPEPAGRRMLLGGAAAPAHHCGNGYRNDCRSTLNRAQDFQPRRARPPEYQAGLLWVHRGLRSLPRDAEWRLVTARKARCGSRSRKAVRSGFRLGPSRWTDLSTQRKKVKFVTRRRSCRTAIAAASTSQNPLLAGTSRDGSDGTRTRDLRRDRLEQGGIRWHWRESTLQNEPISTG